MSSAEQRASGALRSNIIAGTTTAVVIIPQGMAYALVAGLEPIHGLYASLLPLVAYAFVGKSRQMAVGPGALDTLLVGATLSGLAFVNQTNYASYAALLAIEVAVIQLVLGALRAGFLVNFLSRPVISGFTSAAAITIGFSQMRNLFGFAAESSPHFYELFWRTVVGLPASNPYTAMIGLGSAALLVLLKKKRRSFPRALFVVLLSIVVVELGGLEQRGVAVLGAIPSGLPSVSAPEMSLTTLQALFPTALAIAFVGYLTMISIARTFADRNRYEVDANREMIGAGAANLLAGFSGGFPVSASFSRSAVHANAGATSPLALLVVVFWVFLTLLFLTSVFYSLPKATLAAIIITAVFGLIDVAIVKQLHKVKPADMWLLLITFAATLGVGIEPGIGIGVSCSLALFLFRTTQPHTAVLGRVGDTRDFRNVKNYPDARTTPHILMVRFDAQFYFGNINYLRATLRQLEAEAEAPLKSVILEAASINQLDSSADAAFQDIVDDYKKRGVRFVFASAKMPVLRVMRASGLLEKLGPNGTFMNVDDALRFEVRRLEAGDAPPPDQASPQTR